jgi:hypothetical protein
MATSDLNVVLAALLSPPERIGEFSRCGIFRTPFNSFKEASWVRVRPASSLFTPSLLIDLIQIWLFSNLGHLLIKHFLNVTFPSSLSQEVPIGTSLEIHF